MDSLLHNDLVEARARLHSQVDVVLRALRSGTLPPRAEREQVDLKEEAGRRGRDGALLPGNQQNPQAVEHLAREVPCMANTPGGGALVLGVADSGDVMGTNLDADWLRHRLYERVDVAPAVKEHQVRDQRILVLYVAEAREPVEDPDRKLRWRVGAHCVPVDRSEWWYRRNERAGLDVMAAATSRTAADVTAGAVLAARRYLAAGGVPDAEEVELYELLRRLGVLRPDGTLTQAGSLVLCASAGTLVSLTRFDVPGGDILNPPFDFSGLALLEQIELVERDLLAFNMATTARFGFVEAPIRQIPPGTVREAVLNGIVHRDWMQPEPVSVIWFDEDRLLEVTSPGGFSGAVSADNVLTQRHARSPALSDLFRALRLVEKQGVGVDRMYREMVFFGHRPPQILERPGPQVVTRLYGGAPVLPVMGLMRSIEPAFRQRDTRVTVLVYELLHSPFLTSRQAAEVLQTDELAGRAALEACAASSAGGRPLATVYKDVWMLSNAVLATLENSPTAALDLSKHGMIAYRRPSDADRARQVVQYWLNCHDKITSADYARMTGLTQAGAKRTLDRLVPELLVRGTGSGRNAHYVAAEAYRPGSLARLVAPGQAKPPVDAGMPDIVPDLAPEVESLSDLLLADRERDRRRPD